MSEDELLTVKEVAKELKVSERWITQQINDGAIPAVRLGKTFRVYRSALDKYLEERRTKKEE